MESFFFFLRRLPPALLTCGNALCGLVGLLLLSQMSQHRPEETFEQVTYLIWLACLFDLLDGLLARLLRSETALGKQLDSFADATTFGLLPSVWAYHLLRTQHALSVSLSFSVGAVIFLCALFRLSRFNLQAQQSGFLGLPTPAHALVLSSLIFLPTTPSANTTIALTLFSALSMLLPLPLFSFKKFSWKIGLAGLGLIAFFLIFRKTAPFWSVLGYLLIGYTLWIKKIFSR